MRSSVDKWEIKFKGSILYLLHFGVALIIFVGIGNASYTLFTTVLPNSAITFNISGSQSSNVKERTLL